jgi:hypothetical protein
MAAIRLYHVITFIGAHTIEEHVAEYAAPGVCYPRRDHATH